LDLTGGKEKDDKKIHAEELHNMYPSANNIREFKLRRVR
jgi:ribosomal protein S30